MELLQAMGIPTLEVDNYEADDIIGTLSSAAPENVQVKIVTGDRDEFQLIKNNVQVLFTKKGISNIAVYDEKAFGEEYQGLEPRQIIDLKGLMGDTSDNIPGVPERPSRKNFGITETRHSFPKSWPPSAWRFPLTGILQRTC